MLTRTLGWTYEVDPATGITYSLTPTGTWSRTEAPRLLSPTVALPPPRVMRDPTDPATQEATGGTLNMVGSFRRLTPPLPPPRR